MYPLLRENLNQCIQLTDAEFNALSSYFKPATLPKKTIWQQMGRPTNRLAFVTEGIIRGYIVDNQGDEHTLHFARRGGWVNDMSLFLRQNVARLSLETLEKTEILYVSFEDIERVFNEIPKMERYFRIMAARRVAVLEERICSDFSDTAEQKYLNFMAQNAEIASFIPQHYIASYLGVRPQSLSRIRKRMATTHSGNVKHYE